MVEKKEEPKKRGRSSSSSSSSSSGSSSSGSSTGSRSSSSSSSASSRSRSPRRRDNRARRSRSRSARRSPIRRATAARAERGAAGDRPLRRSPSPHRRRRSPSPQFRRRDRSSSRGRRRSPPANNNRRSSPIRRRSASPSKKVCIRNLSKNVHKGHIDEIFSVYGAVKVVDLPVDRSHPYLHRGYGYIEYESAEDAEKAIKYMDGGQIDGQFVSVEMTLNRGGPPIGSGRRSPIQRRRSPIGRKSSPPRGGRGGYSPRRRSPPLRGSGANTMPLGQGRFNRSRSRSVERRGRSRS